MKKILNLLRLIPAVFFASLGLNLILIYEKKISELVKYIDMELVWRHLGSFGQ